MKLRAWELYIYMCRPCAARLYYCCVYLAVSFPPERFSIDLNILLLLLLWERKTQQNVRPPDRIISTWINNSKSSTPEVFFSSYRISNSEETNREKFLKKKEKEQKSAHVTSPFKVSWIILLLLLSFFSRAAILNIINNYFSVCPNYSALGRSRDERRNHQTTGVG